MKFDNAWVTDLVPTADNIVQLVRAARARWKIENEGFNTLKNQGYHLEHNFGHGHQHLSEALFTLNLLAFLHVMLSSRASCKIGKAGGNYWKKGLTQAD